VSPRHHEEAFVVDLPMRRVWDVMADTQHLNQLFFGLSSSQMVARDGDKARLRGTFGVLAPEYDEYPWVFEVPRRYRNERVFTRGLLRRLSTSCELTSESDEKTRVRYLIDVEGAGVVGGLAARYVVARTIRGLAQVQKLLATMAAGQAASKVMQWPPANPFREATLARATPLLAPVRAQLVDDEARAILERLVSMLADGTDADVARMRPYELAAAWSVPARHTLEVFLRAARGGLLRLSWDLLCPSCEAPTTVGSIKDLPSGGHCPACDIDFSTNFAENVEATFSPEPSVRQAERLVFCHGSPASTKSWLAQVVVLPGAEAVLNITLGRGRYRLQGAGIVKTADFQVDDDGQVEAVATVTERGGATVVSPLPAMGAGALVLRLKNEGQQQHRLQLTHRAFASLAATAADVTGLGLFRELFGDEVLAPGQHVGVGQMTILFTDLVGSTAMYEGLGDAAAYGLVRRHFTVLTDAVIRHRGRVVKTVGDAVMASFDIPADAVAAGLDCIVGLRAMTASGGGASGLRLKVGVHTGACLAIEANGGVDYFGRTVNIAARVESVANPDELVLSWTMLADSDVARAVDAAVAAGCTRTEDRRKVKGIADEVVVTRLAPPSVTPSPSSTTGAT